MQCEVLAPISRLLLRASGDEEEALDFFLYACDDDDDACDACHDMNAEGEDDSCSTWTSAYDDGENMPHKSVAPMLHRQNSFDVSDAEIVDESPDGGPPATIVDQCTVMFTSKMKDEHKHCNKQKEGLSRVATDEDTTVATSLGDIAQDFSASEDYVSEKSTATDKSFDAHCGAKDVTTTDGHNEASIAPADSPDDELTPVESQILPSSLDLNAEQVGWNVKYNDLFRYYKKHGTSTISGTTIHVTKHFKLRQWADRQRKSFVRDELTQLQITKLDAINFNFGSNADEMVPLLRRIPTSRFHLPRNARRPRLTCAAPKIPKIPKLSSYM